MLYLTYGVIGGLGTGIVYVGVVGQMVGWFPDRRGFAAGVVAAGYGMGAILTTFPISDSLAAVGYRMTLLQYGAVFALAGLVAALGLKPPPFSAFYAAGCAVCGKQEEVTTGAMLRTPVFWLMFAMMALMSTSGLMVTSQMAAFAGEFGDYQGAGVGTGGAAAGVDDRPVHQWTDAAVLRLGVRPDRAREHDVPGVRAGGHRDGAVAGVPWRPVAVRRAVRGGVLWLGRDILACFLRR